MICDDAARILARELKTEFSTVFELLADGETMLLARRCRLAPGDHRRNSAKSAQ
jgi:hypothetical protein